MEERLGRLELNVEHIHSDVSEIKVDIRRLNDRIDAVDQKFTTKFDSLKDQISGLALTMEKSHSQLRLWAMTLFISMAGGLLTFLARALHWF